MSNTKHYAERDIMELDDAGSYYIRHVAAMTSEKLHSKLDIAAELGYRDMLVDNMLAALELFANIFADYEIHHLNKGDAESIVKAERNREYKEIAEKAIAKARGEK